MTVFSYDGFELSPIEWPRGVPVRWASWSPDGVSALVVGNRGFSGLYDGRRLQALTPSTRQNLRGAAWSPGGEQALLVGNRGAVLHLGGESLRQLSAVTSENLRRAAWHPSGEYALIVGNAGTVLRYEESEGRLYQLPGDRAHTLRSVAFRADGEYALVGAYASRWAGYPRPHSLYRCDGRFLQALMASDDEDDFVAVDWRPGGVALVCGYAARADGDRVNKALLYDGSSWRSESWKSPDLVLGGAWRPGHSTALLVGENGLAVEVNTQGVVKERQRISRENLIGPFWKPDGSYALVIRGPGENVYTV